MCTKHHFDIGREKLKNLVAEREKEITIEEWKIELTHDAVAYYKRKMAAVLKTLEELMARQKIRESQLWELTMSAAREDFNETYHMR